MKREKIRYLMVVTFFLILILPVMSVCINVLSDNLKRDITYDTSVFVTENSTEFLLGYSDRSETSIVVNWLTDNLNAEIVAISSNVPLIHFKTNEIKGFEVQSLIYSQQDFGVRYLQDHPELVLCDTWDPNDE